MKFEKPFDLITILGPTACGKTRLAALLADRLDGEIISADSRQVYRRMDIGTGKDLDDYKVNGKTIPHHLIDIAEPGTEFNVFLYQQEFIRAYKEIKSRNKIPLLCGGSGFYLESILNRKMLVEVPQNNLLRETLKNKSLEELVSILSGLKKLHSNTDSADVSRAIRAIEIETYIIENKKPEQNFPEIRSLIIGVNPGREFVRKNITQRLETRLKAGMIGEVEKLLSEGIEPSCMMNYGLEYKFLTLYLKGQINYSDMFQQLNTAIHQFAKRQMTWFRRMEKKGFKILWLDGEMSEEKKLELIITYIEAESKGDKKNSPEIAHGMDY